MSSIIHKDDVYKMVEIFYQRKFKTFYVNSTDGVSFSIPSGVFVSLGITTSLQVLNDIREVLNQNYTAKLAEIKSDLVGGQYLNIITDKTDIQQYVISEDQYPEKVMNESESKELLEMLQSKIVDKTTPIEVLREIAPKVSQLNQIIEKLNESGWDRHLIQIDDNGNYKMFHTKVNYYKDADTGSEYRIGIYVTEK